MIFSGEDVQRGNATQTSDEKSGQVAILEGISAAALLLCVLLLLLLLRHKQRQRENDTNVDYGMYHAGPAGYSSLL